MEVWWSVSELDVDGAGSAGVGGVAGVVGAFGAGGDSVSGWFGPVFSGEHDGGWGFAGGVLGFGDGCDGEVGEGWDVVSVFAEEGEDAVDGPVWADVVEDVGEHGGLAFVDGHVVGSFLWGKFSSQALRPVRGLDFPILFKNAPALLT